VDTALRSRGIRVGPSEYNYRQYVEQAGKGSDLPRIDLNGDMLWPVLFLYPQVNFLSFLLHCFVATFTMTCDGMLVITDSTE
jgi:hypothetical protein